MQAAPPWAHCRTETQLVLDGIMAALILSTATLMRITVASGSALTIGNTNGAGGRGNSCLCMRHVSAGVWHAAPDLTRRSLAASGAAMSFCCTG